MNEKLVKTTSLVVTFLIALAAVFFLIEGILYFTYIDGNLGAKYNSYIIISALLILLALSGLCFSALFGFKTYSLKINNYDFVLLSICTYLVLLFLLNFINMCFWGFDSAKAWVVVIFSLLGISSLVVAKIVKFGNSLIVSSLNLGATLIGFVLSIVELAYSDGFEIALNIFVMFMCIGIFVYLLFDLLVHNQINNK